MNAIIKNSGGANNNTNNCHTIRGLFLRLKENLSYKEELIGFLDKALQNAANDRKNLEGTQYISLVTNAIQANTEVKNLTLRYVENAEKMDSIINEVTGTSSSFIQMLDESDLQSTLGSYAALKLSTRNIFIILLVISLIIIILNITLSRLISFVFKQLSNDLVSISNGNLTITPPEGFVKRKDEIGQLANSVSSLVNNLKDIIVRIPGIKLLISRWILRYVP